MRRKMVIVSVSVKVMIQTVLLLLLLLVVVVIDGGGGGGGSAGGGGDGGGEDVVGCELMMLMLTQKMEETINKRPITAPSPPSLRRTAPVRWALASPHLFLLLASNSAPTRCGLSSSSPPPTRPFPKNASTPLPALYLSPARTRTAAAPASSRSLFTARRFSGLCCCFTAHPRQERRGGAEMRSKTGVRGKFSGGY